jgi:hypothetical protein
VVLRVRKFEAIAALLALLLSTVSTLAGTLSASELPACCNTDYCPLHHNAKNSPQKDSPNCPGKNMPGQGGSTIRSCDSAPNPIVGTALFVLITPVALCVPVTVETACVLPPPSISSFMAIPLTPPPRSVRN